jgi:hypothetical protein
LKKVASRKENRGRRHLRELSREQLLREDACLAAEQALPRKEYQRREVKERRSRKEDGRRK